MSSSSMLTPHTASFSEPPPPSSSSYPPVPLAAADGADQPSQAVPACDIAPPFSSLPPLEFQSQPPPAQSPPALTSPPSLSSPPLVTVALLPEVHCLWSSRYSTIMPAALTNCMQPADFSASVRRINAVVGCPSWAVTVYILCLAFMLSGIILIVIGAQSTADSGSDGSSNSTVLASQQQQNVTAPPPGGSLTLSAHPEVVATALWVGVAFLSFSSIMSGCCRRRFRLSQLRELHHAVIIENTVYAHSVPRVSWRVGPQLGWWERKRAMLRQKRRVHSHQIIITVGGATTADAEDGQQQQQMFVASLHNTAVPSIRRREGDPLFGVNRWRNQAVQKQLEKDAGLVMRLSAVPDTPSDDVQAEVKDGGGAGGAAAREPSVSRLPPAYEEDEVQHVVIEMQPMQHRAEGEAGVSPRAADAGDRSEGQRRDEEAVKGKGEAVQAATAGCDSPVLVLSPAADDEKEQLEYEAVVAELLREKEEQEAKLRRIAQQIEDVQRRKGKQSLSAAVASADQTPEPTVLSISLSPPAAAEAGISSAPVSSQSTRVLSSSSSSSSSSIPAANGLQLPVPMSGIETGGDAVSSGRSEGSGSVVMLGDRRFSI